MQKSKLMRIILTIILMLFMTRTASADVYFGWNTVFGGGGNRMGFYQDFGSQGHFFATSDYGFEPGGEDILTAKKLKMKSSYNPYTRGQNSVSSKQFNTYGAKPWLSDGGDCVFGLAFDAPFKPTWDRNYNKHKDKGPNWTMTQFKEFKNHIPRFNKAIVYWGVEVPKPGTWGACLMDDKGQLKRIDVDTSKKLYPLDQSELTFPASTVKKIYFGVEGGKDGTKNNIVEVEKIALLIDNKKLVDNRMAVDKPTAYRAYYSPDKPGTIKTMTMVNPFYGSGRRPVFYDVAPFIECEGKKFYAKKGNYPVAVTSEKWTDTLTYPLDFALSNDQIIRLDVTAVFGISNKNSISFNFKAKELPANAKIGFELTDVLNVFKPYAGKDLTGKSQILKTVAGPFGITGKNVSSLKALPERKTKLVALGNDDNMTIDLSLPIGTESVIQPDTLPYTWVPSLASSGDEGIAPFTTHDLTLLETIDLGDSDDPHPVYDITNDPLIQRWRETGNNKLPRKYGNLKLLSKPEKGQVPIATILGEKCRVIGKNETTYFRFDLETRFKASTPYLIVVEHAFDKERRGEFHSVSLNKDGTDWGGLAHGYPFGGFDTGKGPYSKTFKRESIFIFRPGDNRSKGQKISFCFSNARNSRYFMRQNQRPIPDGLAVKSVQIYRVNSMPRLPDLKNLEPEGAKRQITFHCENYSAWMLTQFPHLYGFNSLFTHSQPVAQFLGGKRGDNTDRPGWQRWTHCGTLYANRWLYEVADRNRVTIKTCLDWLLDLGYEGEGHHSFLGTGWLPGDWGSFFGNLPLNPTEEELKLMDRALDTSLSALAKNSSLTDIAISKIPLFSLRNLQDFSKETGVPFEASPARFDNMKRLLDSPKSTVEAWMTWVCKKNFKFNSWLLSKAREHNPNLYVTLNQTWYTNTMQCTYFGGWWMLDAKKFNLKEKGIDNFIDFMRFHGIDPALYKKGDGFAYGIDMEVAMSANPDADWPFDGAAKKILDGFGGGLSVSSRHFDESPKPLAPWGCNYYKNRREFRREFLNAILKANAREFVYQSYYYDCVRGRLNDFRQLAVPYRLLPYAKPKKYAGQIKDTAKQAIIKRYGNRYGLFNPGDQVTEVTLTLPKGSSQVTDLSEGIRQNFSLSENTVKISMSPWSMKTLEIK
jgi:hypothetical protein